MTDQSWWHDELLDDPTADEALSQEAVRNAIERGVDPALAVRMYSTGVEKRRRGGRSRPARPSRGGGLGRRLAKYDENQPRDEQGQWSGAGGGGGDAPDPSAMSIRELDRHVRALGDQEEADHDAQMAPLIDEMRRLEEAPEDTEAAMSALQDRMDALGRDIERTWAPRVRPYVRALAQRRTERREREAREDAADPEGVAARMRAQAEADRAAIDREVADRAQARRDFIESTIPRAPVGKYDDSQPRDENGRWSGGGGGSAPARGADTSALELPGWQADRSLESANGQRVAPDGRPVPGPDTMFAEIAKAQRFDGLPRVVEADEMDALVAQSKVELFRGIGDEAADRYADDLRAGGLFAGRGALGSGIYTASRSADVPDPLAKAREYATRRGSAGAVVRMTLHPEAQIGDHDELRREMVADRRAAERRGASAAHIAAQYQDVGRYAALRGLDVVRHERTGYHVILNRTALVVQRTNV